MRPRYLMVAAVPLLLAMALPLLLAVAGMPVYGELGPAYNYVAEGYNERTVIETGAPNIVTGIILDYRAYDTLMETTVLFTATMGVLLALKGHARRGRFDGRRRNP